MANHKSAAKRARQNVRRASRNGQYISSVRTAVKKFRTALSQTTDGETLQKLFQSAQTLLSKAAAKGLVHKNTASRSVQRLAKRLAEGKAGTYTEEAKPTKKKTASKKAASKKKKAVTKKKTTKRA